MADILNPTAWTEQDATNTSGTLPSWPENMPGKNVNDAARANQGALKRFANQICATKLTTGTGAAYLLSYTIAPENLYTGQRFAVIAHVACSAAPTLNINSLGAKVIRKVVGGVVTDLAAGDIGANQILDLFYVSSLNCFIWANPSYTTSIADASDTVKGLIEIATMTEVELGADIVRAVTPGYLGAVMFKGTTIAGGASISLGDGAYFEISGAVFTCNSIVFATSLSALGRRALLKFQSAGGVLVNGASLVLPGAANITVEAGDTAQLILDTAGVYRVFNYNRASGSPISAGAEILVRKTADQAFAGTTYADVNELSFTVHSGKIVDFEYMLYMTLPSSGNGGSKTQFTASVGIGYLRAFYLSGGDIAVNHDENTGIDGTLQSNAFAPVTGEIFQYHLIKGTVAASGADSLIKLQAAQFAAAGSTVLKAGSYLKYRET